MQYFRVEGEGRDEVIPERWVWAVTYKDGGTLEQFAPGEVDGVFHRFNEIRQDDVAIFKMRSFDDPAQSVELVVRPGMQLFHFYRNIVLEAHTEQERRLRIYCFGWKDRETKATTYMYVLPDDKIVVGPADLNLKV